MNMGLFKMSKCSCTPTQVVVEKEVVVLPNPNPNNFEILKHRSEGDFVAVEILYPDCTNYEGRKILVYKAGIEDIEGAKSLDPHFCEGQHLSPIARFEPTDIGWDMASMLIDELHEKDWSWLL